MCIGQYGDTLVSFWRSAYFRNPLPGSLHCIFSQVGPFCRGGGCKFSQAFTRTLTSGRRAYFRLPRQLSQVCAESLHIFAYYIPVCARATGIQRKATFLSFSEAVAAPSGRFLFFTMGSMLNAIQQCARARTLQGNFKKAMRQVIFVNRHASREAQGWRAP